MKKSPKTRFVRGAFFLGGIIILTLFVGISLQPNFLYLQRVSSLLVTFVEGAPLTPTAADLQNNVKQIVAGKEISTLNASGCGQPATTSDCTKLIIRQQISLLSESIKSRISTYSDAAFTNQTGRIDTRLIVNNSLRDLQLCDRQYQSRQISIDGVDIVQRIAGLIANGLMPKDITGTSAGVGICKSMPRNVDNTQGVIETTDVTKYADSDPRLPGDTYRLYLSAVGFDINPDTGNIYMLSGYDGSLFGPVGKLK